LTNRPPEPNCRFCLGNNLLIGEPWFENETFFCLGSIDPLLPKAVMVVPRRHSENPFEMNPVEWAAFGEVLERAKAHLAVHRPDGYTVGWNVGAVAGQEVFHTHLHIIPRFKGEPNEGVGLRRVIRQVTMAGPPR
jgi:diadenosine tetraphosphate (Ap4A) HIT family hydrolase